VEDFIAPSYLSACFNKIIKHIGVLSILPAGGLPADAILRLTTMTIRQPSGRAKIPLSDNARVVLERRYLAKDAEGRPAETPEEMFRRVAHNIAQAELLYKPLEDPSSASSGPTPPPS
jgi:hypothetical protein